ncbi:hypothetical protein MASR2M44_27220 [Bacteroidota bacterium]
MPMKRLFTLWFSLSLLLTQSCIVSQTTYFHDARALPQGTGKVYLNASTGYRPDIIKSNTGSTIASPSGSSITIPVIGASGMYQLGSKSAIMGAAYMPVNLGCLGWRLGFQQVLVSTTPFSLAAGVYGGYTFTLDSIKGIGLDGDTYFKNYSHADFFLPMTFRLGKESAISLTPRYTFASFNLAEPYKSPDGLGGLSAEGKSLSLGLHVKHYLVEACWMMDMPVHLQLGIGYSLGR